MRINLYLAINLLSFRCFSKNICSYFKWILETDMELMSNNGKICFLVQECAGDICQPPNLKFLLSVKKYFCQALLLFAALRLQYFCLTWYVTVVLPPHLLKLWLRCLPLHVLASSPPLAHHLTVLFVYNTVLLQPAPLAGPAGIGICKTEQ